ncbi:MAG TPA: hypothetical protein VGQ36_07175 [Thermoanaerobaculia bacterium]|jgi:hypothetical protein|nr:hypothetical protein [Thermoanaerobaculia bacterium]
MSESPQTLLPPFYITHEEDVNLRIRANQLVPSPAIALAGSFDDFVQQLMIPSTVMELARKASSIHFSTWENEAIRASLREGILSKILIDKNAKDPSHPAYIRVACTGKGDYDHLLPKDQLAAQNEDHPGDFGSPVVLEIWPGQNYSPIHSHGDTTGIIYCLAGQIDVMLYRSLAWDADKVGLLTLTAGQCAWLSDTRFPVHKVFCPMSEGNFAATFHVYLNKDELPLLRAAPKPRTRDQFDYVDEMPPHKKKKFATYSDLSWSVLRREMATFAARMGM